MWPTEAYPSAELFDPTSETFSPTGNMLAGAFGQTATVLLDGTVLMAGGYGGAVHLLPDRTRFIIPTS